ncbi:MAG: ATP-binding protein [Candidatus Pacebacteria bacterium]|nr:ATP-binding protein [Candidatus Paceibacterota bacterium]
MFRKNKGSATNIMFGMLCVATFWWQFSWFLLFNTGSETVAGYLVKIGYMGIILIPLFFFHFLISFFKITEKIDRYLLYSAYAISFVFEIILITTNHFVYGFYKYFWGFYPKAGVLHPFFLLFLFFLAIWLFYRAISSLRKQGNFNLIEKRQIKYVLWAFIFYIFASSDFLINYGIEFYPLGFLFILIFLGIIAYTIVRYRFMDIKFILGRGAVYLFSLLTIIGLATLLTSFGNGFLPYISAQVLRIGILIISILCFQPVFQFFEKIASKYFYYPFYSSQRVLTDLGKSLTQFLDLEKLSSLIANTLSDTLKLEKVAIVLKDRETGRYENKKNIGFNGGKNPSFVENNFLVDWLRRNKKPLISEEIALYIKDEPEERNLLEEIHKEMKKNGVSLYLPLLIEENVSGIIVLGNKLSNDPFSEQDIELLETLSSQASIAFQNANLYSEIKEFNAKLEQEVDKRTKELTEAYEELKRLDRAKSEFVSIASHQLRTPLTAIKGYISMMLEKSYGELSGKMVKPLENIYTSNERLIKLVNDLLNISRIEAGKTELTPEEASPEDLIQSIIQELKGSAQSKHIKLLFEKPEKDLGKIYIDTFKMRQVIMNIIDNAIRYTAQGEVSISVKIWRGNYRIAIKDSGAGMTKEEISQLFKSFSRGKAGNRFWTEGAGLGLYIAKKFIDLHNGKIWVESSGKGKGSTFVIELPLTSK